MENEKTGVTFEFRQIKVDGVSVKKRYMDCLTAVAIQALDGDCTTTDIDEIQEGIAYDGCEWWILEVDSIPAAVGFREEFGFAFYSIPWFRRYAVDEKMIKHLESRQTALGAALVCFVTEEDAQKWKPVAAKLEIVKSLGYVKGEPNKFGEDEAEDGAPCHFEKKVTELATV